MKFKFNNCIVKDKPDRFIIEVKKDKYLDMNNQGGMILCKISEPIKAQDGNYTISLTVTEVEKL